MQALNVQFLSQQNVAKTSTGIDDSLKKNDSTSSFKSMLEKASKKTDSDNKEISQKIDKSDSEQNNDTEKLQQPDNSSSVAKDKGNPKNNKQEKNIASDERIRDESDICSALETIEPLVVFGQEVVQLEEMDNVAAFATESSFDEETNLKITDTDIKTGNVSSDNILANAQQSNLLVEGLLPNQNNSLDNVNSNVSEVAFAYSDNVINQENVSKQDNVEPDTVSLLNADGNLAQNPVLQDENNLSKSTKKQGQSKVAENTSLFTDKAGNTVINVVDERGSLSKLNALKADSKDNKLVAESVRQNGNVLEVSMVPVEMAEQNILSSSDQAASAVDSTFQQMLSNQIQQSAPEFVKAGNIILKDNENGTINMNLKPEALGNVKISLHLSDKGIEGQIVVATKEAFEAFKQNMDTLRHAFQQNGFENAELNLSFNNNSNSNGSFGQERQQSTEQFFANKVFSNFADVPEKTITGSTVNVYGNSSHIDYIA